MEKEIVKKRGIKYFELEIYGLSKTNMTRNLKNVFLIKNAYKKCLKLMDDFKPDVVIGAGGYVVYPVMKAAKKKGIKTFLHEQNSIPGKSNYVLSKNIDLVGVSFESSAGYFNKCKEVFYSGNPCSSSAVNAKIIDKKSLGLNENKKLIVVVSGSLGSSSINDKFKTFLKLIKDEDYEVIYITGKAHYEEFVSIDYFPENVFVMPFVDNLPGLLKKADLIVSRAGASTISEILALKLPSILVPSPYVANNHQYYNALDLKNLGISVLIEEKKLNAENLIMNINEILDEKNYKNITNKLEKIEVKDSANLIYNRIKGILKK